MIVTWVSRRGGRMVNEDYVGKMKKNGILCVSAADGLGGYRGGGIASKTAVEAVLSEFEENPEFSEDAVRKYILKAHEAVEKKADIEEDCENMASTVVVLLIKGKEAVWGNVGDSRLYMLRGGRIAEVTEDDSVAFIKFMSGEIEYDDIRRSSDQNKLTNALGVSVGAIRISGIKSVDDSVSFLLCTDGWWEYVSEDDIEETNAANKSARDWLSAMLEILESKRPDNSDNYSAAVIVM